MDEVKIYHNPGCSKSNETLALLNAQGIQPNIVNYLETPPSRAELRQILLRLGLQAADIVRSKDKLYDELDLATATEEELIQALSEHPSLIQRPIVISNSKAILGRPPRNVCQLF